MNEMRIATCHCGAVEFEVTFDAGLVNVRRCDCSLCSRKGYVMASVPVENLRVTQGQDQLSLYQWGTMAAEHYFCSVCGVYTHHKRRSKPTEFGVNIACIPGVSPLSLPEIAIGNGGINYPLPPVGLSA